VLNLELVGVGYIRVFRISHPKFFEIICIFIKIMLDLYCFFAVYLGVDGEEKTMGW
jgi:hypothetical protein